MSTHVEDLAGYLAHLHKLEDDTFAVLLYTPHRDFADELVWGVDFGSALLSALNAAQRGAAIRVDIDVWCP